MSIVAHFPVDKLIKDLNAFVSTRTILTLLLEPGSEINSNNSNSCEPPKVVRSAEGQRTDVFTILRWSEGPKKLRWSYRHTIRDRVTSFCICLASPCNGILLFSEGLESRKAQLRQWKSTFILDCECFKNFMQFCSVSFELNSRLTRIESSSFSSSSLQSIVMPRNVEIICSSCFSFCQPLSLDLNQIHDWHELSRVHFFIFIPLIHCYASQCWHSLWKLFLLLSFPFINFLWDKFTIDTNWIICFFSFITPINCYSS
jgi:hypothetical protein